MSYTICSRFKGEHIVYAGYTICTSREHIVYGAFCGSTMQSSENSLVLDVTQSGRSLINKGKRRWPSTVPLWDTAYDRGFL